MEEQVKVSGENSSPERKNLKKKIFIGIATALIVAISFTLGFFTRIWTMSEKERTVAWVISMIDGHYYCEEEGKVKEFTADDYVQAIVDGLLDKYSDYYTAEEYSDVLQTDEGNNFGIGVKFLKSQEDTKLFGVVGNSPVDKAGLKAGDVITGAKKSGEERINFEYKIDFLSFLETIPESQTITLYFTRGGAEQTAIVTKTVFKTSYVKYYDKTTECGFFAQGKVEPKLTATPSSFMSGLDSKTAYISFDEFHGSAFSQLKTALEYMKNAGKTKLILDLRNNGGGSMSVLCDIASLFIEKPNSLIACARYKDGSTKEYRTRGDNFFNMEKTIVLANGNTASASECLIGAMKHYGGAFNANNLVIEKSAQGVAKTYGKGVMQTTYSRWPEKDAIKVTTAIVYQPNNTTINGVGFIATENCAAETGAGLEKAISLLA